MDFDGSIATGSDSMFFSDYYDDDCADNNSRRRRERSPLSSRSRRSDYGEY